MARRAATGTGTPWSSNRPAIPTKSAFRGATGGLRLVERFTRVGPDTIHYEITADDPATWARPWTLMFPMRKTDQPLYEYACHEGNYGLENILRNARLAEERSR